MTPGQKLLYWWGILSPLPFGARLFAWLLGWNVPYSGTVGARVLLFQPGHVKLRLPDRRRVRNHLNSIHAVALVNFGELCTGLALMSQMPAHVRGIVTQIHTEYLKKARGDLSAECQAVFPQVSEAMEIVVKVDIKDTQEDVVASVAVTWRLGLK